MTRLTDVKDGVERTKIKTHFARIIAGVVADKPYYSILYYDPADDEFHQGFGSNCLEFVFRWLAKEFEIVGDVSWCDPVRHSENVTPYSGNENILCKECGFEGEVCEHKYDEYGNYVDAHGFACKYCPNCGAKMDKEG